MANLTTGLQMSALIAALAGSARVAQAIMSTGSDPMQIREFTFKVNLTTDWRAESATDISLDFWRISLKEKITIEYKEHWGLEVECKIVPVVSA